MKTAPTRVRRIGKSSAPGCSSCNGTAGTGRIRPRSPPNVPAELAVEVLQLERAAGNSDVVEVASGITRRWGTCCNVSQHEADRQIAGYWLPAWNDPALSKEATPVALRQGSFEPTIKPSPTDGGDPRHRKRDAPCHIALGKNQNAISGSSLHRGRFLPLST